MSASSGTHSASAYPAGWDQPGAAERRPLTLLALAAWLAAFFGLAGALVTFAAGRSMLRNSVLGALGGRSLGGASGLVNDLIDSAYQTLQSRAILAVVIFVVLTALAFFARGGRTGLRIALTVALLIGVGIWLTNVRDGGVPGAIRALDGLAMLDGIAAIVLAWVPATRRAAASGGGRRR
jgi:hypothetical protein